MKKKPYKIRSISAGRGFTLVELMISIAIALLLMVGVGAVFRTASDMIGVGQAAATTSRIDRELQSTMGEDFRNMAHDGPVLAIHFQQGDAYTSAEDYYSNSSGDIYAENFNPAQSSNGNAVATVPALYNTVSHRMDAISFFVRGNYTRKALASGYVDTSAQASSDEAWVWYGFMALADNNPLVNYNTQPTYWYPASYYLSQNLNAFRPAFNPNNVFGVNWVLGRVAILLRPDANLDPSNGYISAGAGTLSPLASGSPITVTPLVAPFNGAAPGHQFRNSADNPTYNTGVWTIDTGTVDLAQTSITNFTNQVNGLINGTTGTNTNTWWGYMQGYSPSTANVNVAPRFFNAYNWMPKPLNAPNNSQMAFNLVPGCTQFMVEYAGDFLNQDPNSGAVLNTYMNTAGSTTVAPTDGQIDFIVDTNPDGSHTKRIRWYGMPRDVAPGGGPVALGGTGPTTPPAAPAAGTVFMPDGQIPSDGINEKSCPGLQNLYLPDVVPLNDLFAQCPGTGHGDYGTRAPFEVAWINGNNGGIPVDYAVSSSQIANGDPMGDGAQGDCVWGPKDRKPKLIRITIVVNDPNRRIHDGQKFEYIFNVN